MKALLSSLSVFIKCLSFSVVHIYVDCVFVYNLRQCIPTNVLTEALYEKEQSIMTYDAEVTKLQSQVEKTKSASAEKDACIAEYEAVVKKCKGEVI